MFVIFKLILKKFFVVPSFCKKCGRDNHDFFVDNDIWEKVSVHIKRGNVLCYDCFCTLCNKLDLPSVYELKKIK